MRIDTVYAAAGLTGLLVRTSPPPQGRTYTRALLHVPESSLAFIPLRTPLHGSTSLQVGPTFPFLLLSDTLHCTEHPQARLLLLASPLSALPFKIQRAQWPSSSFSFFSFSLLFFTVPSTRRLAFPFFVLCLSPMFLEDSRQS